MILMKEDFRLRQRFSEYKANLWEKGGKLFSLKKNR
jgi:hypothetical protein